MPRRYQTYTEAERLNVLTTAIAEQLSATEVYRRFGVTPVTYYSWRKKNGVKSSRGRRPQHESRVTGTDNSSSPESGPRTHSDPTPL